MTIEFSYSGDISFLSKSDRKKLAKDLEECTKVSNWDYFEIERNRFSVGGSYDNEDGYRDDHKDIERVLASFDIDWKGGAEEVEYEPDWDKMPGGYDYIHN